MSTPVEQKTIGNFVPEQFYLCGSALGVCSLVKPPLRALWKELMKKRVTDSVPFTEETVRALNRWWNQTRRNRSCVFFENVLVWDGPDEDQTKTTNQFCVLEHAGRSGLQKYTKLDPVKLAESLSALRDPNDKQQLIGLLVRVQDEKQDPKFFNTILLFNRTLRTIEHFDPLGGGERRLPRQLVTSLCRLCRYISGTKLEFSRHTYHSPSETDHLKNLRGMESPWTALWCFWYMFLRSTNPGQQPECALEAAVSPDLGEPLDQAKSNPVTVFSERFSKQVLGLVELTVKHSTYFFENKGDPHQFKFVEGSLDAQDLWDKLDQNEYVWDKKQYRTILSNGRILVRTPVSHNLTEKDLYLPLGLLDPPQKKEAARHYVRTRTAISHPVFIQEALDEIGQLHTGHMGVQMYWTGSKFKTFHHNINNKLDSELPVNLVTEDLDTKKVRAFIDKCRAEDKTEMVCFFIGAPQDHCRTLVIDHTTGIIDIFNPLTNENSGNYEIPTGFEKQTRELCQQIAPDYWVNSTNIFCPLKLGTEHVRIGPLALYRKMLPGSTQRGTSHLWALWYLNLRLSTPQFNDPLLTYFRRDLASEATAKIMKMELSQQAHTGLDPLCFERLQKLKSSSALGKQKPETETQTPIGKCVFEGCAFDQLSSWLNGRDHLRQFAAQFSNDLFALVALEKKIVFKVVEKNSATHQPRFFQYKADAETFLAQNQQSHSEVNMVGALVTKKNGLLQGEQPVE